MSLVLGITKNLDQARRQLNALFAQVSTGIAVKSQLLTSYTLALTDAFAYMRHNNAAAITVTIPPQATVAWAASTTIANEQTGIGQVTFAAGAGVTLNKAATLNAKTAERFAVAQLVRTALNEWTLFGGLEAA